MIIALGKGGEKGIRLEVLVKEAFSVSGVFDFIFLYFFVLFLPLPSTIPSLRIVLIWLTAGAGSERQFSVG